MRLLFVTNLFPPVSRGGYELWCQEVAEALAARGHELHILTTRVPGGDPSASAASYSVHRLLTPEVEGGLGQTVKRLLIDRAQREAENLARTRQLVTDLQPDAAMIWGMWNIPRSVPRLIEDLLPGRVAYYFCDYWAALPSAYLQRWQEEARHPLAALPKQIMGLYFRTRLAREEPVPLRFEHPFCVSRAVRRNLVEAGVPVQHGEIVYGGTPIPAPAPLVPPARGAGEPLRLLYVGRLEAEKGVHTLIDALAQLAPIAELPIHLDLVGGGTPDYERRLRQQVAAAGLGEVVSFWGRLAHDQIPEVLAAHDILLFPSEWEEPFARTVLEAMAAGLLVIGTETGGTGELLVENETGLTYPAGDAGALASQIGRALSDRELRMRLAAAARQTVEERFSFGRMVNELETRLRQIASVTPVAVMMEE